MTYTLSTGGVTRDADNASIPTDPMNRDYQEYLAWVDRGNTATPAPVPPAVVSPISMWQGRAVMSQTPYDPSGAQPAYQAVLAGKTNLLDATNALVAAAANPILSAYWEYATELQVEDTMLNNLATSAGLTNQQVKTLFAAAHALSI